MKCGEKPYRAEQVFKWLYIDKAQNFDEMTNLSLELREKLKQNFEFTEYTILKKQTSKDGTKKYLFELSDKNTPTAGYSFTILKNIFRIGDWSLLETSFRLQRILPSIYGLRSYVQFGGHELLSLWSRHTLESVHLHV